tara:strand:+ start:2166 stop:2531 length:366 start_codon:yes stop_codon:yes gene_type:complete
MSKFSNNLFYDLPDDLQQYIYKVGMVQELNNLFCSPNFTVKPKNKFLGYTGWRYTYSYLITDYCYFCALYNSVPSGNDHLEMFGFRGIGTEENLRDFLHKNNQKTNKNWKKKDLVCALTKF